MFPRAIIVLTAVGLGGILFARIDAAKARGGRGFHAGFSHAEGRFEGHGGRFESRHSDEHGERKDMHSAHSRGDGSHDFGESRERRRSARLEGHWQRSSGFGDTSHHLSSSDGRWQVWQ